MSLKSARGRTPKAFAEALSDAEQKLKRPPAKSGNAPTFVELRPAQVKIQPELFQPREFSLGLRDVDQKHVERLARRIGNVGELDPILVVKLGNTWVCVDGHHRLRAYRKEGWGDRQIKCEWFSGSIEEAVSEGMRRNSMLKLEVPLADRQEEAWKRTLAERWTKEQLVKDCGVAEGTIAFMRRVIRRYRDAEDQSEWAKEFRKQVGRLNETSWSIAKLAFANVEPRVRSTREAAASLAKSLAGRHTDKLSRSPEVTALALQIYDRDLLEPLRDEITKLLEAQGDGED
jgi:hypothetical protein